MAPTPEDSPQVVEARREAYVAFEREKVRRIASYSKGTVLAITLNLRFGEVKSSKTKDIDGANRDIATTNQKYGEWIESNYAIEGDFAAVLASIRATFPVTPELEGLLNAASNPYRVEIPQPGPLDNLQEKTVWAQKEADRINAETKAQVIDPLNRLSAYLASTFGPLPVGVVPPTQTSRATSPAISAEEIANLVAEKLKNQFSEPVGSSPQPAPSSVSGFVQFETWNVEFAKAQDFDRINNGGIHAGDTIRIRFFFANRGFRPVHDVQSWGVFAFVDPALNPGVKLRQLALETAKAEYQKSKGSGNDLGVGITSFNFAQSPPLKPQEAEGLKSGTLRVHLILFGAWTDDEGQTFYWTQVNWTNWPQVPLIQSFWKDS